MNSIRITAACLIAAFATAGSLHARGLGGPQSQVGSEYLAHVFGRNAAFTAAAVSTVNMEGRGAQEMEMQYAVLDGNMRIEMDMTRMKGSAMPPEAMAQLKMMGMDRTVMIHRPSEKKNYMIYPGLKSFCAIATPNTETAGEVKPPKIERAEIGKETVEGHPCVKNKLTMTMDDGTKVEMFVWQATDLKEFPVKTEMTHQNHRIVTIFRDIKQGKPDAALFQPPAGFKEYGSMQEMMMGAMGAMMGGPGKGIR